MNRFVIFLVCAFAKVTLSEVLEPITFEYNSFVGFPYFTVKSQPRFTRVKNLPQEESNNFILDFIGLVNTQKGYKAEEYKVTTNDDYILTLHRLYSTTVNKTLQDRKVVYLQHGLLGDSDMWIVLGSDTSLAYQLAREGFDVWLGNVRGNFYSRNHHQYRAEKHAKKFFNFSFEEMALRDVPKLIDTVLEKTGKKDLTYIGHSMGTVMSYVMLSTLPEYNKKINLLVSLAPIAYFTKSYVAATVALTYLMSATSFYNDPPREVLPHTIVYRRYADDFTEQCRKFFAFIMDTEKFDITNLPLILQYFPSGTSLQTLQHLQQLMKNQKFARYDYGCTKSGEDCENERIYNSANPPEYNLKNIKVPTAIYFAEDDVVAHVDDVQLLKEKLPCVIRYQGSSHSKFNHNDFLWSSQAKELIYNQLVDLLINPTKYYNIENPNNSLECKQIN